MAMAIEIENSGGIRDFNISSSSQQLTLILILIAAFKICIMIFDIRDINK